MRAAGLSMINQFTDFLTAPLFQDFSEPVAISCAGEHGESSSGEHPCACSGECPRGGGGFPLLCLL